MKRRWIYWSDYPEQVQLFLQLKTARWLYQFLFQPSESIFPTRCKAISIPPPVRPHCIFFFCSSFAQPGQRKNSKKKKKGLEKPKDCPGWALQCSPATNHQPKITTRNVTGQAPELGALCEDIERGHGCERTCASFGADVMRVSISFAHSTSADCHRRSRICLVLCRSLLHFPDVRL